MKNISIILLFLLLAKSNYYAQIKLFSNSTVSDIGTNNNLGSSNSTKNIGIDFKGNIYVVYSANDEVRIAKSINGGMSFLPSSIVANTFFNVNPEIEINENGTIYIAWTLNTSIFFTLSIDEGQTFTSPKYLIDNIAGSININSYKNNVYLSDQGAEKLLINSNYGIGEFEIIDTGVIMENSEILIDKEGKVYIPMDNPDISFFESTNQGLTLIRKILNPPERVFFSSYALSIGSFGTYIIGGGGDPVNSDIVSTKGYRINVVTGESEVIKLGKNTVSSFGRTLYANDKSILIDGYKSDDGYLMMNISKDQGNSFEPPIIISKGDSHSITISKSTNNIIVAFEKDGEIFLSVYTDSTQNFEITNDNTCLNFSNNFSLTNQSEIKSVVWNFDDPSSGANNTSTTIDVTHQFSSTGVYNVTAEVTHIDNTSYTIPKEIEIFEAPNINTSVSLKQCDNSDINGFSFFNLNEVKEKIIANPENFTITFHEEKIQAENNGIAITEITNYQNKIVSSDKIWARVENVTGCFKISEVDLFVSTTQIPTTLLKTYYECDNGTDTSDGIATFNFSDINDDIINLFPINQLLEITYYRNEENALSELNKITDITNYQNIGYPNQQNIYVRVDSKVDNSCLGLGAHISLNVEKTPVANPVILNPECDNDRDGLYDFDTSTIQSTLIGNQTNVSVSYFDSNGTPLSSPLPNPFKTASETITARIENINSLDNDGKCFDETEINFVVNTVPIANTIAPQEECDDDFDGIIGFDTSAIETTIIGTQTGLIVKYFDENDTPLPSPLPNPFVTASQTIKVRLENPVFDVCFEETTVDFIVNQKPDFTLIPDDIICMNNTPKLELNIDNSTGNYTYTWRDENDVIVGNEANIAVFKGGTYSVIATSDKGCTSNEKSIIIKESAISTININDIEVQDDSENNFIKINTANLGLGDYEFRLLDNDANIIYDYQDDPLFENLEGGVYLLELNDKNNCGSITFEIALISFPNFFTPNADGTNDNWQIKGIDKSFYKSGLIHIFNRYGHQIAKFTIEDSGWDGTYNGKILNANDYWFRVVLINENDVVKIRTGNFSLIRQ